MKQLRQLGHALSTVVIAVVMTIFWIVLVTISFFYLIWQGLHGHAAFDYAKLENFEEDL